MPLLHQSIADIPEKELVKSVVSHPLNRDMLLNIKGLAARGASVRREVSLDALTKNQGDIDILIVPDGARHETTAIQIKRFKVRLRENDDVHVGHPSRLEELFSKGAAQANDNARLGFYQVYLWIFICIDAREQNMGRFTYDGPSSLAQSKIRSAISERLLDQGVGLMTFEWTQPMDNPPFMVGSHHGHLIRLAEPTAQAATVTSWVETLSRDSQDERRLISY